MIAFPFGKHKHQPLGTVPTDYLRWALRECDLETWLAHAITEELRRRRQYWQEQAEGPPPPRPQQQAGPPAKMDEIIRQWYRDLVMRWHPDRGGSKEAMQAINDAHDRLRQLAGLRS
jgi:hypothetical protein